MTERKGGQRSAGRQTIRPTPRQSFKSETGLQLPNKIGNHRHSAGGGRMKGRVWNTLSFFRTLDKGFHAGSRASDAPAENVRGGTCRVALNQSTMMTRYGTLGSEFGGDYL